MPDTAPALGPSSRHAIGAETAVVCFRHPSANSIADVPICILPIATGYKSQEAEIRHMWDILREIARELVSVRPMSLLMSQCESVCLFLR